jgi:glutathione S-transferase
MMRGEVAWGRAAVLGGSQSALLWIVDPQATRVRLTICGVRWSDWDGPGKAEPARLAFAVKGVAFEDVLLTGSSWETLKPATPWGQVPVLEVDGEQLAQSGAINSYLARALGLCPADPMGAAKVDEFCDTVEECSAVCLAATYGKEVRLRLRLQLDQLS